MSSLCVWSLDDQLLSFFGVDVKWCFSSFVGGVFCSNCFVILFGLFGGVFCLVLFDLHRNIS